MPVSIKKMKKRFNYTGNFDKIFYSAKEVAGILGVNYEKVKKVCQLLRYRKVGNIFEIPVNDLKKIKDYLLKLKVKN